MKYIGLDCHKQYDHATMIDTETGEIKVKRLKDSRILVSPLKNWLNLVREYE